MEKLTGLIERVLMPVANRLKKNSFLNAITSGFMLIMGVTIVGALATLLGSLNIAPYQSFIEMVHLKEIFSFLPTVTTDMIALYAVFAIARSFAKEKGFEDDSIIAGLTALMVFMLMIPQQLMAPEGADSYSYASAIHLNYLGSAGLFSAMIIGVVVPALYCIFLKHKITIKMPAGVPPMISRSFASIIPGIAIGLVFSLARLLFTFTTYGDFNTFIYSMLRTPVMAMGASPVTFLVLVLLANLLWFFGIHGGMVVMPFLSIMYMSAALENLAATEAGTAIPHIITNATWNGFAMLGGAGGAIGLALCMLFIAKSKRYKTLGKLALPGTLCGISEPLTFGTPLVLNTITLIPMLLIPTISFGSTYLLTALNVLPRLNGFYAPLGTPVVFMGFLMGGWQLAVWQVMLIAFQFIVYLPFFKVLDRQALKEEAELEAQENAEAKNTEVTA